MASGNLTDAEWELTGPLLSTGRGRPGHGNWRLLDGIRPLLACPTGEPVMAQDWFSSQPHAAAGRVRHAQPP
jgi:hypothetical protein